MRVEGKVQTDCIREACFKRSVPARRFGSDEPFSQQDRARQQQTRWLNDQSTPVLDDGTYRRAIKQGLFER